MVEVLELGVLYIVKMFKREPWWAEFWSAVVCIGWGCIIASADADLRQLPSTRLGASIANDIIWIITSETLGFIQISGLLSNLRFVRWFAALIGSWFWTFLALSFYLSPEPLAPGIALYIGYAGINLFSVFRLLKDYK